MTTRLKQLGLLMAGQVLCVGAGLWLQQYALRYSVQEDTAAKGRSEMAGAVAQLRRELEGLDPSKLASAAEPPAPVKAILDRNQAHHTAITVVDRDGHALVQYGGGGGALTTPVPEGQTVVWKPVGEGTDTSGELQEGTLELPDGPHLAVACNLSDGRGQLFIHRPFSSVDDAAQPLARALLPVGVIMLVWTVAVFGIIAYLVLAGSHEELARERARTISDRLQQTQTLIRTRDAVIFALAKLADFRDHETGSHLERISNYVTVLCEALRRRPQYAGQVTPGFVRLIGLCSVLHDIGKVGIEDRILRKPGKRTAREHERIQLHTVIAGNCLGEIAQRLGRSDFLQMAREIAIGHHERWDGSGYPVGLKGEETPLAARIVAIADVYDALATRRVYKEACPHEECVEVIRAQAGRQFDPDLVAVWLTVESKFREIAGRLSDAAGKTVPSRFLPDGGERGAAELGSAAPATRVAEAAGSAAGGESEPKTSVQAGTVAGGDA